MNRLACSGGFALFSATTLAVISISINHSCHHGQRPSTLEATSFWNARHVQAHTHAHIYEELDAYLPTTKLGRKSVSQLPSQPASIQVATTKEPLINQRRNATPSIAQHKVVPPAPPHRSMAVMTDKVSLRWFCDAVLIMRSTMQPLFLWIYHSYDSSRFHNEDYLLLWLNVVWRSQVASSTCISIRIEYATMIYRINRIYMNEYRKETYWLKVGLIHLSLSGYIVISWRRRNYV